MTTVQQNVLPSSIERGAPRLAIFFAEYFPPYMGSDRRIFDIARSLPAEWAVEFGVTPPLRVLGGRHEAALQEYFRRHFIEGIVEDESGGIHGHYFLLPALLMAAWRALPMPIAYGLTIPYLVLRAVRYLKQRRPDLVVVAHPSYLCGVVGLLAAKIARVPVLLDYPDAWTPLAIETALINENGMVARVLRRIERFAARLPDRIVSITEGLTSYIRAMGTGSPIDVVGNGADSERFNRESAKEIRDELGYGQDDLVILYSGRLEPWSGVHELVETIRTVCSAVPSATFLFVGDGSASHDFQNEIVATGLEKKVRFLGFQPFSRMPRIVASVDAAIVPFPKTATTEFCSPVKLFEYMMMRTPLITTDLPGIRESVSEEHVMFVKDLSAGELSRGIVHLLRDAEFRSALAENALVHAKDRFTYRSLAKRFAESMTAVAGKAPARV